MEQQAIEQNKVNRQIEAEEGRPACMCEDECVCKHKDTNKFYTFVHPDMHQ